MALEGRIIGLDVGDRRIGVAVSDGLGITAQPRGVIVNQSLDQAVQAVVELANETRAMGIVVGMPLTQRGERGEQAQKVQEFVDRLSAAVGIDVVTMDERFTTALVQRRMAEADVSRKRRKQVVDQLAAQQILQTYLDRRSRGGA